jgi:hypothetical protein
MLLNISKKKFMSTRCVFTIPRIFKTKFITQTRETKKTNLVIYQSLLGMPIVYVKLLGWSRSMGLHSPDNNACWDGQEMGRVWLYLSLSLGILIFFRWRRCKTCHCQRVHSGFPVMSCHVCPQGDLCRSSIFLRPQNAAVEKHYAFVGADVSSPKIQL